VPSSSLTVTTAQASVIRGMQSQFDKAEHIIDAALGAPDLDEDAVKDGKLTREQRIAAHALQPQRNAPVYLSLARGLVELKAKLEAGLADDAPKLVHHMVHLFQPREYERVELKPRGQIIDVEATNVDPKDTGSTPG
jgi:hypothetical protein